MRLNEIRLRKGVDISVISPAANTGFARIGVQ